MQVFFIYLVVINAIAFLLNGFDKWLAINQRSRISERMLLCFVLSGGTIGAAVGMLMFRHKTAKTSYLLPFFGILFLQGALLFFYLNR